MSEEMKDQRNLIHISHDNGEEFSIIWYNGSSLNSIKRAALAALGLPRDSSENINLFQDPQRRSALSWDPSLSSTTLKAFSSVTAGTCDSCDATSMLQDVICKMQNIPLHGLPDDPKFQGQYVKFERILSHLANERTWLAWIRAALTMLSSAFTIWKLYDQVNDRIHPMISLALYILGLCYVLVVPMTVLVGWLRFERTKHILGLSKVDIHEHFGSLGVFIQAGLLGCVLLFTVGCYWSLGDYYTDW